MLSVTNEKHGRWRERVFWNRFPALHRHTPVETYNLEGQRIYVKREDQFGMSPAPPLAKLRGVSRLLLRLKQEGLDKPVACMDTRVSKAGWGLAYICKQLGLKAIDFYPRLKNQAALPYQQRMVKTLGGEVVALHAQRTVIMFSQTKEICRRHGYHLLPLGLTCKETVSEVANETAYTLQQLKAESSVNIKTIVVCTGTGTMFSGIVKACQGKDAPFVIGVSCGMTPLKQTKRIKELLKADLPENCALLESGYDYYDAVRAIAPFPSSPYYDQKAWVWLTQALRRKNVLQPYFRSNPSSSLNIPLDEPILFWNIGA